jgi:hypothetical protein
MIRQVVRLIAFLFLLAAIYSFISAAVLTPGSPSPIDGLWYWLIGWILLIVSQYVLKDEVPDEGEEEEGESKKEEKVEEGKGEEEAHTLEM